LRSRFACIVGYWGTLSQVRLDREFKERLRVRESVFDLATGRSFGFAADDADATQSRSY
jgi:hypothetical protein